VADIGLLDELQLVQPHFCRSHFANSSVRSRLLLWTTVMVVLVGGSLWSIPYLPLARAVPLAWEEKLGAAVAQSLTNESGVCDSENGRAALDALIKRLTAHVDTPYNFTVQVSDNDLINAFAAPGGHIVIFDGLIQFAESPNALAGVLAHEIAHVLEHHSMEGLIRIMGTSFVLAAVVGDASALAGGVTTVAQQLLVLSHSREDEATADKLGVTLLFQADIATEDFIQFFQRLKEEQGNLPTYLKLLSTHPLHDERIGAISAMADGEGQAMSDADWKAIKNMCLSE
jgi:predicted Zn-dependent protease